MKKLSAKHWALLSYTAQTREQIHEYISVDALSIFVVSYIHLSLLASMELKNKIIAVRLEEKDLCDQQIFQKLHAVRHIVHEVHLVLSNSSFDEKLLKWAFEQWTQKTWVILSLADSWQTEQFKFFQQSGVAGIVFCDPTQDFLQIDRNFLIKMNKLIQQLQVYNLQFSLEAFYDYPDFPRLLPFSFDRIGLFSSKTQIDDFGLVQRLLQPRSIQDTKLKKFDRIFLHDFCVQAEVGVYHHEYGRQQSLCFSIDADIYPIQQKAVIDLSEIVSYDLLLDGIYVALSDGHIKFVEEIAERIAQWVLTNPRVAQVKISIKKQDIVPGSLGIEMTRGRI